MNDAKHPRIAAAVIAAMALVGGIAQAATHAGKLDGTFARDGRVAVDFTRGDDYPHDQPSVHSRTQREFGCGRDRRRFSRSQYAVL